MNSLLEAIINYYKLAMPILVLLIVLQNKYMFFSLELIYVAYVRELEPFFRHTNVVLLAYYCFMCRAIFNKHTSFVSTSKATLEADSLKGKSSFGPNIFGKYLHVYALS